MTTPATLDRPIHPAPKRNPVLETRRHIQDAVRDIKRIEIHLNAYASDDAFGQPNLASDAIYSLGLALAELDEIAAATCRVCGDVNVIQNRDICWSCDGTLYGHKAAVAQ